MPRIPHPWWHAQKRQWCCKIDGKLVPLGPDKEAATTAFHRLRGSVVQEVPSSQHVTVKEVLDRYTVRARQNTSERNYEYVKTACKSFADTIPASLFADELRPHHITAWIDKQKWSDNTKRRRMTVIQSAFIYADRQGIHRPNPIPWLDKPAYVERDDTMPKELWQLVLQNTSGDFKAMLEFSAATGCRPQEATAIEARHVQFGYRLVIFKRPEAKGKRKPRVLYVPMSVRDDLKARCDKRPEGPLFRGRDGQFTRQSIRCRFRALKKKKAFKDAKVDKLYHYMLRHTWVTGALAKGIPVAIVAELAGHSPEMALGNYGHLDGRITELLDAAEKASS